jgi:hypothetical protein
MMLTLDDYHDSKLEENGPVVAKRNLDSKNDVGTKREVGAKIAKA